VAKIVNRNEYLDIPELILELHKRDEKVICYKEECSWLDIGRMDDYEKANEEFESLTKHL
jgi:NDP-sugar pyrophosphorylase family protein